MESRPQIGLVTRFSVIGVEPGFKGWPRRSGREFAEREPLALTSGTERRFTIKCQLVSGVAVNSRDLAFAHMQRGCS